MYGETTQESETITIENSLWLDTTELIHLRAAHQLALEDYRNAIREKTESLRMYAQKPGANQGYIDRETEFISVIKNYSDIAETLLEQLDLRNKEDHKLIEEANVIFSEIGKLSENGNS